MSIDEQYSAAVTRCGVGPTVSYDHHYKFNLFNIALVLIIFVLIAIWIKKNQSRIAGWKTDFLVLLKNHGLGLAIVVLVALFGLSLTFKNSKSLNQLHYNFSRAPGYFYSEINTETRSYIDAKTEWDGCADGSL